MIFAQNNLKNAASPYLQQHKNNTVWWQEWNRGVLKFARAENKIIFASIGYSTCLNMTTRTLDRMLLSGLYVSGHDADTGHEEGATYLWTDPCV